MDPLVVLGAQGHGDVVGESAEAAGYSVRGFLDTRGCTGAPEGRRCYSSLDEVANDGIFRIVAAVGHNEMRERFVTEILASPPKKWKF